MVFNDGKDGKAEGKDNGADYKLIIKGASTSVKDGQGTAYDLSPVYPNPTSNQEITMINYRVLNTTQRIAVKVYDLQGNIVRTIVDEDQTPAQYMVYWDKNNDAGIPVVSGSYIYVIQAGQYRTSNTIIVNN
jgi:flagellar hook assembly protein FlgD